MSQPIHVVSCHADSCGILAFLNKMIMKSVTIAAWVSAFIWYKIKYDYTK